MEKTENNAILLGSVWNGWELKKLPDKKENIFTNSSGYIEKDKIKQFI